MRGVPGEVAAAEGRDGERGREQQPDERPPAREADELAARLGRGGSSSGRQLGRRPRLQQQVVHAAQALLLLGRQVAADELAEVGPTH